VTGLLVDGAVLTVGLLGLLVLRRAPRWALVLWLAVVCCVPVWFVVPLQIDVEPEVAVTLVLVACLLPLGHLAAGPVLRLTLWDGLVALFFLAALLPITWGAATIADDWVLAAQWGMAFLAGRLVAHRVGLPWVYGAVAVAFTLAAGFALVEFLTAWNPFALFPGSGSLYDSWAPVQLRADRPRAEGAFGHSIALGASLAMAIPLTLAAPFRPLVRVVMVLVMLGAVAVTFSRDGLLTAVLGVVLTVVLVRRDLPVKVRMWVMGGLGVAAVAAVPWLLGVFSAAGSEATDSAGYRLDLLGLVPHMAPLGLSDVFYESPAGGRFFGAFRSIDSALILLGLTYGWIPLVIVALLLVGALGAVLTGHGRAPTVAVVAQLPAFITVALITQYASVAWFIAGLAVFAQSVAREPMASGEEPFLPRQPPELVKGLTRPGEGGRHIRPSELV